MDLDLEDKMHTGVFTGAFHFNAAYVHYGGMLNTILSLFPFFIIDS